MKPRPSRRKADREGVGSSQRVLGDDAVVSRLALEALTKRRATIPAATLRAERGTVSRDHRSYAVHTSHQMIAMSSIIR